MKRAFLSATRILTEFLLLLSITQRWSIPVQYVCGIITPLVWAITITLEE